MKKAITCIVCPRGCAMTAEILDGKITVTGNTCPRGEKHAIAELTAPVRTLTTTIRVANREDTMVPVKSAAPVPKGSMFELMSCIRALRVNAPIAIGEVLLRTPEGISFVATASVK